MKSLLVISLLLTLTVPAQAIDPSYYAAKKITSFGKRLAGSFNETRAHNYTARRFREAGLRVYKKRFKIPNGESRNTIGSYGSGSCLKVLMAHIDSATGPGANDNASGVGILIAVAPQLKKLKPKCRIWLVATGAEERPVTGSPDHLGALNLVRLIKRNGWQDDLRYALSLDMVGRGSKFWLRSPQPRPRSYERQIIRAGSYTNTYIEWHKDSSTGNSDHREFELNNLPAMVIQAWQGLDPCHHKLCDTSSRLQSGALIRIKRLVRRLILVS